MYVREDTQGTCHQKLGFILLSLLITIVHRDEIFMNRKALNLSCITCAKSPPTLLRDIEMANWSSQQRAFLFQVA